MAERSDADPASLRAAAHGRETLLLAAIARGDRHAFAELVRLHHQRCFRVACRLLADAAEAEDVAQEVFLKLWADVSRVRQAHSAGAYLSRMAANGALDRLRRRRAFAEEMPDVADGQARADAALERQAVSRDVTAAVDALPDRQRAALVLVHFEGFGNAEAAAMLGVSVEAVESLLARARRGLKAALADRWRELLADVTAL